MKTFLAAALFAAATTPALASASSPTGTPDIELRTTLTLWADGNCANGSATFDAHAGDLLALCHVVTNHSGRELDWHYLHDNALGFPNFYEGVMNQPLADGASLEFMESLGGVWQDADFSGTWTSQDAPPPGYSFDDTVPFNFIDISTSPTATLLIDAPLGTNPAPTVDVQPPFPLRFYEQFAVDQLCIALRGAIFVNQPGCSGWTNSDTNFGQMPVGGIHDMIAPAFTLWNDAVSGGKVYADTQGTAPNRRYIVQWQELVRGQYSGPGITMQAIIDETTSQITFQYLHMDFADGGPDYGNYGGDATSGIQRSGSYFNEYSGLAPNLTDGKAVRWTPDPQPYSTSASSSAHLRIIAAQIDTGPSEIIASANSGGTATANLTIGNSGNDTLQWTLGESLTRSGFSIAQPYSVPAAGASAAAAPHHRAATFANPRSATSVPAYAERKAGTHADYVSFDALAPQTLTNVNDEVFGADMPQVGGFFDNDFTRQYLLTNGGCNFSVCWGYAFSSIETHGGTGAYHPINSGSALAPTADPLEQWWQGMKWDATTHTAYAVAASGTSPTRTDLYSIDPHIGTPTWIARLDDVSADGTLLADIAIAPNGSMYGIDEWTDTLIAIDKSNGHVQPIGPTGLDTYLYDLQSIDFDPSTGVLYYATFPQTPAISGMYTLDPASGKATLIGPIGDGTMALRAFSIAIPSGPCVDPASVPWVSFNRNSGSTAAGGSDTVQVNFDASGLAGGVYRANVCIDSNTPFERTVAVPVTFTVTTADSIFANGFESAPSAN